MNEYIVQPYLEGYGLSWRRAQNEWFASDFLHYYTSGVMARSQDRLRIYDVPVHFPYMNALIAPRTITKDSVIQFSPSMIAIMSVVTLIPLVPAYISWTISVFIFGTTGLYFLLRRVGNLSVYESVVFVLIASSTLNSTLALKMGQWTWLLTGLFCYFFVASLKKKELLSALCLGLLTVKPQYCLPLVALTAVEKRFQALILTAVVVLAFNVWAANLIGWDNVIHYPQIVAALAVSPAVQSDNLSFCSLRSFFSTFLPINQAISITSILYFATLGAFGLACLLLRNKLKENIYWIWSIAILVSLIFSPYMFQYDANLVCIPAALTMTTLNPVKILAMRPLSLKIWHLIFLIYPVLTWLRVLLGNEWNYLYAFVNLGLLICALIYLKNRAPIESAQ